MASGRELVGLDTTPSMFGKFLVHACRECEVWTKNFLCQFIKGLTRLSMARGAELSLILKEPK